MTTNKITALTERIKEAEKEIARLKEAQTKTPVKPKNSKSLSSVVNGSR